MPTKIKRKKQPKKRRVTKMSALAEKTVEKDREERLARISALSKEITEKTMAAGVTLEEIKEETHKVFINVKEHRRTRRS